MAIQKPSVPKGTRDFSPAEMVRRNYIFDTIRSVYKMYGYLPIETPAMENTETLMGKYGEEGDRLIFRVLESGEYMDEPRRAFLENQIDPKRFKAEQIERWSIIFGEVKDGVEQYIRLNIEKLSPHALAEIVEKSITKEGFSDNEKKYFAIQFAKYLDKYSLSGIDSKYARRFYYLKNIYFNRGATSFERELGAYFRIFFRFSNEFMDFLKLYELSNTFLIPSYLSNRISKKALRYDLTVPFARYVVQHQNEITFPFKRYQIQPVWRADRPQKGRYREFYQCDADVIGSNSLINEVELVQIIDAVFTNLNVPTLTKINNRKILSGIAEIIGEKENIVKITVAIDKLDKIGVDGVNKELRENGLSETAIEKLQPLISFTGSYTEKIALLKNMLAASETGMKGIAEIEFVFNKATELGLKTTELELDITLARGLNYYTGAIFEVKAKAGSLTVSICGGGRYDDLTGIFGLPGLSGVGISFGADRIYDVLLDLNLYPEEVASSTRLLFVGFDDNDLSYCLPLLKQVRDAGIAAELYPDAAKMKKQMAYADAKSIPFVAIVGENERKENVVMLKNMKTGNQEKITVDALIAHLHQ